MGEAGRDPRQEAFELAVAALGRKERTERELREYLSDRDVSADAAEDALDRLIAIGEIDDERYARLFAEDRRDLRGWGPVRIRATLVDRGVDHSLAARAATEDHEDIRDRAVLMLAERSRGLEADADRASALGYLARLGYDHEVAYEAIRRCARGEVPHPGDEAG